MSLRMAMPLCQGEHGCKANEHRRGKGRETQLQRGPIILVLFHPLLATEELNVDAYVDKCATLDSLLTKIRALSGRT